jgi:EthD domain
VESAGDPQGGPRAIYLARRHPFLDHDHFVTRWREHGILSQQLPGWVGVSRYEQNPAVVLPPSLLASLPGGTGRYDGVGMSWFRDIGAMAGFATEEQQTLLRFDELQTFDALVATTCFVGERASEHGERRCGIKLVTFLRRAGDDRPLRALATALLETAGFSGHVVKYTETRACPFDYPGGGRPGLEEFGAVVEIGFRNADALVQAVSAPGFSTIVLPAWKNATDKAVITVAVKELLLYDDERRSETGSS